MHNYLFTHCQRVLHRVRQQQNGFHIVPFILQVTENALTNLISGWQESSCIRQGTTTGMVLGTACSLLQVRLKRQQWMVLPLCIHASYNQCEISCEKLGNLENKAILSDGSLHSW